VLDERERKKAGTVLGGPLVLPEIQEGQGMIDAKALARFLDVSYRCLYRLMAEGALPAPITLGGRSKRWSLEEIMAWVFQGCPPSDRWRMVRTEALRQPTPCR
jgi:predicted DNA-binding transcriptional regulator AlpA